jgi:hypothetical protein
MSKMFLFLIGLLLWGAAYATPASILQYKIEPTEEQKSEFFRKAAEDPDLYTYNPLQMGNVWWYTTHWVGNSIVDPPFIGREVVDSTFIESNKYYMIYPSLCAPFGFWIRNVGDTTILWDQHNDEYLNDLDDNTQTCTLVNEDFTITATNPDEGTWVWPVNDGFWYPFKCFVYETGWINFYGFVTQFLYYDYAPLYPSTFYSAVWLRGIGPVYCSTEWAETLLHGCIINGTSYGDIPSSAQEDLLVPSSPQLELGAYPNPFINGVTVKIRSPNNIKGINYEVYNIRGQVVVSQKISDLGRSVLWDGNNVNGQRTPSGLYLLRVLFSNGFTKTIKLLHL